LFYDGCMSRYLAVPRHWAGIFLAVTLVASGVWLAYDYTGHQPINRLSVATTFYPLAEIAEQIGGNDASVTTITPPGEEPHAYHPSAQQMISLQHTDVFVYNGATFEPWVDEFLSDYPGYAVAASQGIDLLSAGNQNSATTDPHFWLDPVLMITITETVRDALIEADPTHTADFRQRAAVYIDKLEQLDKQFRQGLAACRTRRVVSSHESMRYLAKRYSFSETSIAGISPEEEPTPARLAEISQTVKQTGITTVLYEEMVPTKLAETLAKEAGATTAVFDPIEGLGDQELADGETYLSVQQQNLQTLREAMSCQ
jgi:zinc transport system substrate-binding protein